MANNRLYLVDEATGEKVLLAKGFGQGWTVSLGIEDELAAFFAQRDEASSGSTIGETDVGGVTTLVVLTEYQLNESRR